MDLQTRDSQMRPTSVVSEGNIYAISSAIGRLERTVETLRQNYSALIESLSTLSEKLNTLNNRIDQIERQNGGTK